MLDAVAREGFWIASEERLSTYASSFATYDDGVLGEDHRPVTLSSLLTDKPALSAEERARASSPGVLGVSDAQILAVLESITPDEVRARTKPTK